MDPRNFENRSTPMYNSLLHHIKQCSSAARSHIKFKCLCHFTYVLCNSMPKALTPLLALTLLVGSSDL